jgi:ActR/RegA family two-component response regulator
MTVDICLDRDDLLAWLAANQYEVVVLDRDVPGTHGDDICRAMVSDRAETRVLMLTNVGYCVFAAHRRRRYARRAVLLLIKCLGEQTDVERAYLAIDDENLASPWVAVHGHVKLPTSGQVVSPLVAK